jgi:hypothetical protein
LVIGHGSTLSRIKQHAYFPQKYDEETSRLVLGDFPCKDYEEYLKEERVVPN